MVKDAEQHLLTLCIVLHSKSWVSFELNILRSGANCWALKKSKVSFSLSLTSIFHSGEQERLKPIRGFGCGSILPLPIKWGCACLHSLWWRAGLHVWPIRASSRPVHGLLHAERSDSRTFILLVEYCWKGRVRLLRKDLHDNVLPSSVHPRNYNLTVGRHKWRLKGNKTEHQLKNNYERRFLCF